MNSFFNWKKIGKIVSPLKNSYWTKSHCMLPTPVNIKKNIYRIFYTSRNNKNQSFITFTDIEISNKIKIIKPIRVINKFIARICIDKGKLYKANFL